MPIGTSIGTSILICRHIICRHITRIHLYTHVTLVGMTSLMTRNELDVCCHLVYRSLLFISGFI